MQSLRNSLYPRFTLSFLSLLLLVTLLLPDQFPAAAQAPGDQPTFESAVYALAGGGSEITSNQARLTGDYFGGAGTRENLVASAAGVSLAAGATSGTYTSASIRSPLGYTTDIGLTWLADVPEGASVAVEARLSGDGQNWGGWQPVPVEYYPVGEGEYSGALLWVDMASVYLQFRLTLQGSDASAAPLFRRLTLYFNDTSRGPTDMAAAAQAQVEAAGAAACPAKPAVISRTAWGCPDGQSSPRWAPTYQSVTHIVINHTATANTATDWAKVVRAIWNYHANTLKWGDVGYHYLIDPQGRIYEGRAGGDDVIGAYDGFNRGSMGLGYIGCYGNCEYLGIPNADPSAAMLEAGNNLMAWKAGQKGINPLGSGNYCNATLPTIVPRSEVTCRGGSVSPGDRMRARIPAMRTSVQQKIAACGAVTTLRVNPSFVQIPGGHSRVTDVEAANVSGLYGAQFRMTYNPVLVGVVDADPNTAGVQIALGSIFAGQSVNVARNTVDTTNGIIEFAATLVNPASPFNGTGSIAKITWRGDRLGVTDLLLSNVALSDRNGQAISPRVENGRLEVVWPTICGVVLLQGRTNHSGTSATLLPGGPTVTTNAQGQFCFEPTSQSYSSLKVVRRSYLIGEKAAPQGGVGTLTLPGGDVNNACGGDNCINIYDLTVIASCFGNTACLTDNARSCADINGDGKVDILDLTIAAGNFGKCGPVTDWK